MAQTRRTAPAQPPAPEPAESGPRVLKKYPNRRLYDTQASCYITLADVKKMVLTGQDFVVRDAKTGDDLTRSILLQIILEEEAGGMPMFSSPALAQIIRFYGHAMQGMMGSYLEKNIQTFAALQQRIGDSAKGLNPELWAQFMSGQAPVVQGLMGDYLEQSKNLFMKMQGQMAEQAKALFPGFVPPKK
jgi:polyhydroxyalkanoate synthesis repressor PhaR